MAKKKGNNPIMRILITLLGMGMIFWGCSLLLLGIFGEKHTALITSVTRHGGERNDANPGRYNYSMGYTFTLPDGKKIDGFSNYIGSSVYLKATGTSTRAVRYFNVFPYINALEEDTKLTLGQPILILVGAFLIWAMNPSKAKLNF